MTVRGSAGRPSELESFIRAQAEKSTDFALKYELSQARAALGEALMRSRLALTASDLIADGFSDDVEEPNRILSALCSYLVSVGAVDPMEADGD